MDVFLAERHSSTAHRLTLAEFKDLRYFRPRAVYFQQYFSTKAAEKASDTDGTTHTVQLTGPTLLLTFNGCCLYSSATNLRVFSGSELQCSSRVQGAHSFSSLSVGVNGTDS